MGSGEMKMKKVQRFKNPLVLEACDFAVKEE